MGTLTVPFVPVNKDNDYEEITEIIELVWDYWMEEGKNRERLGELIRRNGFQKFLEKLELDPVPQNIQEPRSNPYIFWKEDEVPGGWEGDIDEFRKHHNR